MFRLLLLVVIAGLVSCSPEKRTSEVYSVLYDTTDSLLAVPNAKDLWEFMDADNSNKEILIRYSELSDVDINAVEQLKRDRLESGLLSNEIHEKRKTDAFKNQFQDFFNSKQSQQQSHSVIFKPILEELSFLSGLEDGTVKHCVVYTNLMENSDWMSFYSSDDLLSLYHDTDKITKRYMEQVPSRTDFSGVSLHIIYKPTGYDDNRQYVKLRQVYQDVFDRLEVPISFSANISKAQRVR